MLKIPLPADCYTGHNKGDHGAWRLTKQVVRASDENNSYRTKRLLKFRLPANPKGVADHNNNASHRITATHLAD